MNLYITLRIQNLNSLSYISITFTPRACKYNKYSQKIPNFFIQNIFISLCTPFKRYINTLHKKTEQSNKKHF